MIIPTALSTQWRQEIRKRTNLGRVLTFEKEVCSAFFVALLMFFFQERAKYKLSDVLKFDIIIVTRHMVYYHTVQLAQWESMFLVKGV